MFFCTVYEQENKKMKCSLNGKSQPYPDMYSPIPYLEKTGKRASVCFRPKRGEPDPAFSKCRDSGRDRLRRGSLTVETAMVLPIFLLCCLSIFSLLGFYERYLDKTIELKEQVEHAAMWAYGTDKIADGALTDLANVVFQDGYITVPMPVSYISHFGYEYLPSLHATTYARIRAWVGYLPKKEEEEQEKMVYLTENASVYHTTTACTHLDLKIETTTKAALTLQRNSDGAKYHACELCVGKGAAGSTIWIAKRGTRYHNNPGCSGLKRTVRTVKESEASHLPACSRCGKK